MIHATVIGNVGNETKLETSGSGKSYLRLRVAASYKDKDGEKTTWIGATIFEKRAEALAPYINKGDKVALRGTLYTTEKDGKTYVDLRVDEIELLGSKKTTETDDTAPRGSNGAGRGAVKSDDFGDSSDIPF